ncbi:MAG TPA: glycosyltransferase family 4 protein [Verrucomicrobiae bacterium]|nr:glycosyltransferase family 4 protein [Verrucomicrobiae bacterium]
MKVCHVITRLIVGGAQENTVASCLGLRKRGYDVDLVIGPQTGPEGSLRDQATAAGVPVIVIKELQRAPNPLRDAPACLALQRLFANGRYDIVHTHSGKAGFVGRLAAKLARVPIIVHTIHGPSFYDHQNPIGNWLFRWAEQLAGAWTTQFVSVADAMTARYLAAGVGTPGKFVTIYSGMDVDAFVGARRDEGLRRSLGIVKDDLVVGKIARLFRLKGHEFLFQAAPRICATVPRVKFLLVGDGVYRKRFAQWAKEMGLRDRFVFAGLVPPHEIPRYVASMDVLVHLSLREGLPRAVPQALACGKPVVAFDVDGAREVCLDGQTGLLVEPGDVSGLAAAVIRLLQDRGLADRMGATGRGLVRERFSEELMVQELDKLYRRLGAETRSTKPETRDKHQ